MKLHDPITRRCFQCKTILLKHEPGAFAEGRKIEIKCKCNAMNYIATYEADSTPEFTQGRTQAGNHAREGISDRSTDHEGTQRASRPANR